ncbi:hypothetical protein [Mesomycoplasma ovipneumoniae]|uniref:hypothetical protein n=1 Tax=Mesomycoplasma ovipneumoniae TaxID=29562 RepID=UPI00311B0ECE
MESANNNPDLKLDNGISFLYAFKPNKLPKLDVLQYFLLKTGEEENNFNLLIEKELFVDGVFKIGADFIPKPKPKPSHGINFDDEKPGFQTTYNGKFKAEWIIMDGGVRPNLEIEPKNPHSLLHDFLNNSSATIILGVDIEKKDNKSVMNMKLYSSESDDAKEPIFTWKRDIPTGAKLNFGKGVTFGTTKSENQKAIDQKLSRSETGITFKGFVLFDKPESDKKYKELFEQFRSEYV